jgi:hypothetical protein
MKKLTDYKYTILLIAVIYFGSLMVMTKFIETGGCAQ